MFAEVVQLGRQSAGQGYIIVVCPGDKFPFSSRKTGVSCGTAAQIMFVADQLDPFIGAKQGSAQGIAAAIVYYYEFQQAMRLPEYRIYSRA